MGLFTRSNAATVAKPAVEPSASGAPMSAETAALIAAPPPPPARSAPVAPPNASLSQSNAQDAQRMAYLQSLKVRIHQQLVERLDVQNLMSLPPDTVRNEVRIVIRDLCQSEKGLLNSTDQERLMDDVMDETFGLGPLETLLKDQSISDILVNRADRIYVERKGRIELAGVKFRDNQHLRQIIDRIVGRVGRRIDETSPMVDARLA